MAKKKLSDFLRDLAQNAKLREEYLKDPRGVMKKAGIDEAHQDMIMNTDTEGLKKVIGDENTVFIVSHDSYKK